MQTCSIDPSPFLAVLAGQLPTGSTILDIGCGSGRDLLWLKKRGFRPTGFEKSRGLARLAREYSGCRVLEGDFAVYDFSGFDYDAILLIGTFVHLQTHELVSSLVRVARAIKSNGLIYLTLKEGVGYSRGKDGRVFMLRQHEELKMIFNSLGFAVRSFARNESALDNKDMWLGYLLK